MLVAEPGSPGFRWRCCGPTWTCTLLEPLLRRFNFLTQTVDDLGITDRVTVLRDRAENHRGAYDVVVSRALAPLSRLISWCAPLRADDGVILALKGSSAVDEVDQAARELRKFGLARERFGRPRASQRRPDDRRPYLVTLAASSGGVLRMLLVVGV